LAVSQNNLEIVRRAYEAFSGEHIEDVLEALDPDIEWTPSDVFPDRRTFRGHDEVLAFVDLFRENFDGFWMTPDELVLRGDDVVVPLKIGGRGKGSGIVIEASYVHVWTLREGRAVRVRTYTDLSEALDSLGEP